MRVCLFELVFVFTSAALCVCASFPAFLFVFGSVCLCGWEIWRACAITESLMSSADTLGRAWERIRFHRHHGSLSLLRLIQLNTVNNWSDGETEARPHGMRMTSSVKAMETDTVSGDWSSCVLSSKNTIHPTSDCLTRTVNRFNRDDKMSNSQKWNKSWSELRTEN